MVPGAGDDVDIDVPGVTVTISSNVESVNSVTIDDPLVISGGGLTVAADSTVNGGLAMTGGSLTASGSGVSLTVMGTTTVSEASLDAENGATLSLPNLMTYSIAGNESMDFEATGPNAVLSLPALTSLGQLQDFLYLQATQGGQVLAPALTTITSPSQQEEALQIYADGNGSEVNLSGLVSMDVYGRRPHSHGQRHRP